jgi:hypothetical protein
MVVRSRRLQFTKNVAWVGEIEVACNILVEILLGK